MSIKVYTACSMTGHKMDEIVERNKHAKKVLESSGITILDPVLAEHIKSENRVLGEKPLNVLKSYWNRDKEMIRESHVLLDITPTDKSEGAEHERAYARYCLWKPIVRVFPIGINPSNFIPYFEDDLITHSLEEASIQIVKYWGSFAKRAMWRIAMLNRCLLKWIWYQIREWK